MSELEQDEKQLTLEERFAAIEEIISAMEKEDVPLDTAFSLYKEGMGQVKEAARNLDAIEKAMLVMNEDGELEEF